jgi:hypothetical protein
MALVALDNLYGDPRLEVRVNYGKAFLDQFRPRVKTEEMDWTA